MFTSALASYLLEIPNERIMLTSQIMIGYPLLSQDSLEADWTILENNEKVPSLINIPYLVTCCGLLILSVRESEGDGGGGSSSGSSGGSASTDSAVGSTSLSSNNTTSSTASAAASKSSHHSHHSKHKVCLLLVNYLQRRPYSKILNCARLAKGKSEKCKFVCHILGPRFYLNFSIILY